MQNPEVSRSFLFGTWTPSEIHHFASFTSLYYIIIVLYKIHDIYKILTVWQGVLQYFIQKAHDLLKEILTTVQTSSFLSFLFSFHISKKWFNSTSLWFLLRFWKQIGNDTGEPVQRNQMLMGWLKNRCLSTRWILAKLKWETAFWELS